MSDLFNRLSTKTLVLYACLVFVAFQFAGCGSREQRAQSYYEHGMSYLEKKDFVKARVELKNALQIKGDMVEAWRALAKIDEHDQNIRALAGSLRKVVELDPKDVVSRAALARILLLGGALDDALKMADAASQIEPQNAGVIALKAAVLFKLKDTDGATRTAQKALEIDPNNTDASVMLSVVKFSQGDSEGALRILANVTGNRKDDLSVLFLQINIFDRMGNFAQVESLLRKVITLHPNEPSFRTQLIKFYVAHNRQDDAVKELRAVADANPANTNAGLDLVNFLGAVKGPAAARTELVARINSGGAVFPYQIALAKIDFGQGNIADSAKLLEQLIRSTNSRDDILTAQAVLAEMYVRSNNVAAAEPLISDMLRADSRNINALKLRASIRIDRGQTDDAIADLRSALNDQPRSPELLSSLGFAYERSGSITLADKAYFDATKASGFSPNVGLSYVAFLRRRGLTPQAENVLTDLANRNQNNIAVLTALAQVKLARQDWVGAHAVADSIKRIGDKSVVADQIDGAAFSGQNKFNDSLAVLQNVYNANPGAVQPMAALVRVYLQSNQINKAEAFVQSVLNSSPANAEALVLMGSIQLMKNNPNQAVKLFETAIKQQPKEFVGYKALADFYAGQKKNAEALGIVQAGLQQQPKNFALRLTLAGLLEAKGDYEPAIAEYESILKDQPGSMVVANNLASLLADRRTDKASLERANSIAVLLTNSDVPQFKDTLGWVAFQRGDFKAAISLLEGAVAALPNLPLVRYHLGVTYLAIGQYAKGSEQFKKARELAPNDPEMQMKIDAALKSYSEKPKG